MRLTGSLLLTGILAATAAFAEAPSADYAKRRLQLRESLGDGSLVLFGAQEPADLHYRFFQEPNFYYLTGWQQPDAALLLTRDQEILFLPERSVQNERFVGRRSAPGDSDAPSLTGFREIRSVASLTASVPDKGRIYSLANEPRMQALLASRPFQPSADAAPLITELRLIKDAVELALIENATRQTMEAHLSSWKRIKPGAYEYQIATALTSVYRASGCERDAYLPIVGSGPNSVILHYGELDRQLQANETVVMDVGAECEGYATDITRTVPSSGKFTPRQKEIYEIVLEAQKAAIAAVRPGISLSGQNSLYSIAREYIDTHGKDVKGQSLGRYFTHGLGHYVGLDVHDPGDYREPLKAGMVITIEPGVYIPEENIGVRIEDVVLVTENGARVLSSGLPKEIAEIEKRVGK